MSQRNVVIVGATSAIAQCAARRLAAGGAHFVLVARNAARLREVGDDLLARGAGGVELLTLELRDAGRHGSIVELARSRLGEIDIVLVAHGTLPDQAAVQDSYDGILRALEDNALSVISLCTVFSAALKQQGKGTLVVISSVAGDRGRASNYIYGTAKAAVSVFLEGLRNRLHRDGVHVLTVKPGFVDTPMTAHIHSKGLLWATPERVARDIVRAIDRRKDVLYTPFFWRAVMFAVRAIPERLFKRMSL